MAGDLVHPSAQAVKRAAFTIRLILAGIFLYSGLIKASSSAQFAIALAPFTFLPENSLRPLSILLPLCELAGGGLILIPRTKHLGAGVIFGLCVLFAIVLGWALANGIIVSCSCFGEDEEPSAIKMGIALGRDLVLAGLAFSVFVLDPRKRSRHLSGT